MSDGHHRRLKNEKEFNNEKTLFNRLYLQFGLRLLDLNWMRNDAAGRGERGAA